MKNTRKTLFKQWVEELSIEESKKLIIEFVEMLEEQELISIFDDGVPRHYHTGEPVTDYIAPHKARLFAFIKDLMKDSQLLALNGNLELGKHNVDVANKLLTSFGYPEIDGDDDSRFE